MDNISTQQAQAAYRSAPQDIRDLLADHATYEKIEAIGAANDLNRMEVGLLAQVISALMIGLIRPNDFVAEIIDQLRIPQTAAAKIAQAVNHEIFSAVKDSLTRMHTAATALSPAMRNVAAEAMPGTPMPLQTPTASPVSTTRPAPPASAPAPMQKSPVPSAPAPTSTPAQKSQASPIPVTNTQKTSTQPATPARGETPPTQPLNANSQGLGGGGAGLSSTGAAGTAPSALAAKLGDTYRINPAKTPGLASVPQYGFPAQVARENTSANPLTPALSLERGGGNAPIQQAKYYAPQAPTQPQVARPQGNTVPSSLPTQPLNANSQGLGGGGVASSQGSGGVGGGRGSNSNQPIPPSGGSSFSSSGSTTPLAPVSTTPTRRFPGNGALGQDLYREPPSVAPAPQFQAPRVPPPVAKPGPVEPPRGPNRFSV